MPTWLPSVPYPPAREDGYWAPITSTLDWCEENYYATPYSAEIVNTLTNISFLYLGLRGLLNCHHHAHPRVFNLTFLGYLFVGCGSLAFHTTLKYPMQLVDELSMIYTTLIMFWATFEYDTPAPVPALLGLATAGLAVGITAWYHWCGDPSFHQACYALLTAAVLGRSMWVMELELRPYFRNKRAARIAAKTGNAVAMTESAKREAARIDARDEEIITLMWKTIGLGLSVFLGGFVLWSLDNAYCSTLRQWRHQLGLPWGILLEGHGWWHLMTGFGAYVYIIWGIWLRHCLEGRQDQYELSWPSWLSIPEVVLRSRQSSSNSSSGVVMNGQQQAKKLS